MRRVLLALSLCACTTPSGTGILEVRASGEHAAVDGYPTSEGLGFADGWTMTIDRVIVSLDAFAMAHDGVTVPLESDPVLVNLHAGDATLWRFPAIAAGRYENVGFRVVPATRDARRIGDVSDADADEMVNERLALLFEATAHHAVHGDVALDLGVPIAIHAAHCVSGIDGTSGVVVTPSGTTRAELTFHLDHVFLDSLIDPSARMRFEAFAATRTDGRVTYAGLEAQSLADLRDLDGTSLTDEAGATIFYDPGSIALPTGSLRDFVFHQASTIGHLDGEGHCDVRVIGTP